MSGLFTPPRYFKDVAFHRHTDRTIGWLELFYDLVYVATLIQIGNFLSDNLTLLGFGQFLVMLFVVWWSWGGETLYQNRYVADDIWHRLLVFMQIGGVATMGLSVSGAFGELSAQFAVGYVLVRVMTVLMYVRIYFSHPQSRTYSIRYMMGFAVGISIWVVAIFLPSDIQWIAWLVAIVFEALWFARPAATADEIEDWGPDAHHMLERFGIFTIIVLGEAFVKVLDDAQGTVLGLEQILFGVIALLVLYTLWWLYFSDTADRLFDLSSNLKLSSWSWGHFFLATSLVAFGVAIKKLFAETINYSDQVVTDEYRLLLTAAIAIFSLALAMINYGLDDKLTPHSQIKRVIVYLGVAVGIAGMSLVLTGLTATQFTGVIAVIMVLVVALNIYHSFTFAEPQLEH
ncbi:MAG: low temperature requirement protein A [Pleurocapsa minor GSE-CHR-MK-17-07R]|jgi:low temperature requirement protein LtrA|nr:low temperature requirement protein A [Pleurocapsa minor GSE-CHR-MK 17-07R]